MVCETVFRNGMQQMCTDIVARLLEVEFFSQFFERTTRKKKRLFQDRCHVLPLQPSQMAVMATKRQKKTLK